VQGSRDGQGVCKDELPREKVVTFWCRRNSTNNEDELTLGNGKVAVMQLYPATEERQQLVATIRSNAYVVKI
jgi:hypothetical protein